MESRLCLQLESDRTRSTGGLYLERSYIAVHFNAARELRACRCQLQPSNPLCMLNVVDAPTLQRKVEAVMWCHLDLPSLVLPHSSCIREPPPLPRSGGQGLGS
jgi:hypothetical protein